ncbi:MAG TPA: elongation factor G, partial [Clostridiales bacterium]|nr:elongation factor G [Clostridiales bacterium]
TFDAPTSIGDNSTIVGRVPVSTFIEYPSVLASFTKGKGLISFNLDGYDICHNPEEVIEKIGYDSKSDKEHTSHSIYVSHGKTFSVE